MTMDEDRVRTLLDRAALADQPPSTVNIARARLVGARRRRITRVVIPAASTGGLATAVALILTGTLGFGASGDRAAPAAQTAYVANYDSGTVTPISTATNKAGRAINTGANQQGGIVVTPNGSTVYVLDLGKVVPISTATKQAGRAITVDGQSAGMAVTPNGRTLYVVSYSGLVTPISTATDKAGKVIKVADTTEQIVVTPDGKTVYVISYDGLVTPISTMTNKPGKAINVGTIHIGQELFGLAVTPDGKTVYVVKGVSGKVVPISTATNKPGNAIKVGRRSGFIAFTR
jgi:hyaluronoglucosaminidase